jgi:hypothetical protein
MKQRWLLKPQTESKGIVELDSATRDELVALMATAIECVYLQRDRLSQQPKGAVPHVRTTTESENH